jgi:hypothetical protein
MVMIISSENSASPRQTHYDVLQISHTATMDEIKAAYRALIIECHPDKLSSVHNNYEHKQHHVHASNVKAISETLSGIDIDIDDAKEETPDEIINDDKRDTVRNHASTLSEVNVATLPREDDKLSKDDATIFHQLQVAYHCLRDPDKRRQYDETIRRTEERVEWIWKGASTVKLSDMECDWCCVVDEENGDTDEDTALQKVFFYPCRCGDTFQVLLEELLESVHEPKNVTDAYTNRVWQCESCSLTIRVKIDIDVVE